MIFPNRKSKKLNILLKCLFILCKLLSIFGFICVILLLRGYRLIIDSEIKPDWQAVSSIGTILAVGVALFITKWQETIDNRKQLEIGWLHVQNTGNMCDYYLNLSKAKRLDEICLRFVNIGNRRIVLDSVYLQLKTKELFDLQPILHNPANVLPYTLPYILDPEMAVHFHIRTQTFSSIAHQLINKNRVKDDEYIFIIIKDTSGKEYSINTECTFSSYVEYLNPSALPYLI